MRQFKQGSQSINHSSRWGLDHVTHKEVLGHSGVRAPALRSTGPLASELMRPLVLLFSFQEIIMINLHDDYGKIKSLFPKIELIKAFEILSFLEEKGIHVSRMEEVLEKNLSLDL